MSTIQDSILLSTKKVLGIHAENEDFDTDVIMHINTALTVLHQIGVGPTNGFMIEDEVPTWYDLLGEDALLNPVKTYIFLRVRMVFDPPATSFVIDAMQRQMEELEWRINVHRETVEHPLDEFLTPEPLEEVL